MLSQIFFISTNINFKLMPISRLFLFLFAIIHLKFHAQDNKINNISYNNYVWAANIDLVNGDYKNLLRKFAKRITTNPNIEYYYKNKIDLNSAEKNIVLQLKKLAT